MKKLILMIFFINHVSILHANCLPAGTAGDDVVSCTGATSGYQYLLGGSDNVTLTNVTGSAVFWLDQHNSGNPLTDGNDTFIARDSQFFWAFAFGGDDEYQVYDSTFSNIYGDTNPMSVSQRGNDTFLVERSTSNGLVGKPTWYPPLIKASNFSSSMQVHPMGIYVEEMIMIL